MLEDFAKKQDPSALKEVLKLLTNSMSSWRDVSEMSVGEQSGGVSTHLAKRNVRCGSCEIAALRAEVSIA